MAKSVSFRRRDVAGLGGEPFIAHTLSLLTSPAWRGLSFAGRRVIDRLELEHLLHGGKENGRLVATFAALERDGVWRRLIAPAIKDTVRRGLVVVEGGGRGTAGRREPTRYRLTYLPHHDGSAWREPTHDWRRFQDELKKQKPSGGTATELGVKPPLGEIEKARISAKNLVAEPPPDIGGETATAIYIMGGVGTTCLGCGVCAAGGDCPIQPVWTVSLGVPLQ